MSYNKEDLVDEGLNMYAEYKKQGVLEGDAIRPDDMDEYLLLLDRLGFRDVIFLKYGSINGHSVSELRDSYLFLNRLKDGR